MWKELHLLTFINVCWIFMETTKWMWAALGGRQCVLSIVHRINPVVYDPMQVSSKKKKYMFVKMLSLMVVVIGDYGKIVFCSWKLALNSCIIELLVFRMKIRGISFGASLAYVSVWVHVCVNIQEKCSLHLLRNPRVKIINNLWWQILYC